MSGVVDDTFEFLETSGLAGGSTDWLLLRRRIVDLPDRLVTVTEDGGFEPEFPAESGIGDSATMDPAVQITVRASAWDGDASFEKALSIMEALHGLRTVQLSSGGDEYLRVQARSAAPIFAGFDQTGRPLHTIAFRMLKFINAAVSA